MTFQTRHEGENALVSIWLKRQLRRFTDKQIDLVAAGSETPSRAQLLCHTYGEGLIKASELLYFSSPHIEGEFKAIIDQLSIDRTKLLDGQLHSQLGFLPADCDAHEQARRTRK